MPCVTSLSGWALDVPTDKTLPARNQELLWRFSRLRFEDTSVWAGEAFEMVLSQIAALPEDWDVSGAHRVSKTTVDNARVILRALTKYGYVPDSIFPNPSATIEFEWDRALGRARLEIGISTFAFYTVSRAGLPIMYDGLIDGTLDVEQICFALATIDSGTVARSVVDWNKRLGVATRHAARAA